MFTGLLCFLPLWILWVYRCYCYLLYSSALLHWCWGVDMIGIRDVILIGVGKITRYKTTGKHSKVSTNHMHVVRMNSSIWFAWWHHQMETFSALLAICAGDLPVPGEFPSQRPVARSCDVSLFCVWINGWVNNHETGDLRRYRAHYDVSVMW